MPGFLGGEATPEEFRWMAASDTYMPCHQVAEGRRVKEQGFFGGISYAKPDRSLPQCAGRAIFMANQYALPRDSSLLKLPRDLATVFEWPHEFIEYHGKLFRHDK
jgi:hypothetical protein